MAGLIGIALFGVIFSVMMAAVGGFFSRELRRYNVI